VLQIVQNLRLETKKAVNVNLRLFYLCAYGTFFEPVYWSTKGIRLFSKSRSTIGTSGIALFVQFAEYF
jgi:hypothetical protein